MSARHYTIALSLLAALAHPDLHAQPSSIDTLVEQGRFWQSRSDYKRATEVWEKLLLASPSHPDALYGMAAAALGENDHATASKYLEQLRAAAPRSRLIPLLEQEIYLSRPDVIPVLHKARELAAARQMDAAVAQYDKLLQGKEPQGAFALEYYNFLGYSTGGRDRAIEKLRGLVRSSPNNGAYRLALARHLVREVDHRREGLEIMRQLSSVPSVASQANEEWALALTWIGPPGPDWRGVFEDYLKVHPKDEEIRKLLAKGGTAQASSPGTQGGQAAATRPWRQDPDLARGFRALDNGDLNVAEQAFQARLKRQPNDADALGGLGLVRMQQNDHVQAEQLLVRAARAKPNWNQALNATRYWRLVNQAGNARANGDLALAQQLAEQAIRLDGKTSAAHNMIGHVQADRGQLDQATRTFAQVLKRDRRDTEAMGALISALSQQGRHQEAEKLISGLTPEQRASIGDEGRLRAALIAGKAKAMQQRGDLAGAQRAFEDAMRTDPNNAWLRLDLARLYIKQGATTEARGLVDGLLRSNPDMPDALYTSALLSMELGEWEKAYATMVRIPEKARTSEMAAMEQQLWVHAQAAQAGRLAKLGRTDDARRTLRGLEATAGGDPGMLGAIASAYVDAGDANHGLSLIRQEIGRTAQPSPDIQLAYAGLLLKTGQDVEAASTLRALQNRPMNAAQKKTFDDLAFMYNIRQADLLRERGEFARAHDTLAPALAQRPSDTMALAAMARLYAANGENDKALEQYKRLLQKDPDNADLQMGAAIAATQMREYDFAENAINHALSIAPEDPDMLANAARLYRARGKTGKAIELFTAAIEAEEKQLAMAKQPGASQAAAASDGEYGSTFVALPSQGTRSTLPRQAVAGILDEPSGKAPVYVAAQPAAMPEPQPLPAPVAVRPATVQPAAPATQVARVEAEAPVAAAAPARGRTITAEPGSVITPAPRMVQIHTTDATLAPVRESSAPLPAAPVVGGTMLGIRSDKAADLRQELATLQDMRNPEVRFGVFGRNNNGEEGLSKLSEVQAPLEVRLPVGDGTLALQATAVRLDAGSVDSDFYNSSRFGGGPVAIYDAIAQNNQWGSVQALNSHGPTGKQRDSGVGLSVAYEQSGLRVDLGTTPLGFQRTNFIGGLKFDGLFDEQARSWYSVDLSRRAVTDSLVSFAGAHDSRTGQTWGGVTSTGLQLQVGQDSDRFGYYGYGGWHSLNGHNVESNWRANVGAGVYWHVLREQNRIFTAGLNLGATFYDKNQRFFTYGHGGYFSPQRMYSFSLPFTWAQRSDRFTYKLQGAIGIQRFSEDEADYFPTSASLQANALNAVQYARAMGYGGATATYAGQSKTGFAYNLQAAAEYRLSNHLVLGSALSFNNAKDYRQWAGGLYLRYTLYPSTRMLDLPVTPYRGPYGN